MEEKKEKLSYEQLNDVAGNLSIENQKLKAYVVKLENHLNQVTDLLNKLPYLFKVVELGTNSFDTEFVSKCTNEIKQILNPEEENKDEQA